MNNMYNVTAFGADNTGKTISTKAFNDAMAECSKNGGGTVFVPAGTYETGSIEIFSNTTFHIDAGAKINFVNDISEYPVVDYSWEGVPRKCYRNCLYANNAKNIAITGRGTIDGQGAYWWKIFRDKDPILEYPRPVMVGLQDCENVLIETITVLNSPSWTIHPLRCKTVNINKLFINNPADSPNTDGIDPESCKNVHISDCHIDVGDDCIAIKAGVEDNQNLVACENITITNCTMVHGHGGVVIGSEMSGDVKNVVISNCVFDGTDRGVRIKSRRGRGGNVKDILITNIFMNNVFVPFVMNMYYFCGPRGKDPIVSDKNKVEVTNLTPTFKNISLTNIMARNVHASAGFIYGLPEMPIENVYVSNYVVEFAENPTPQVPAMMTGIDPMTNRGFYLGNSKNFTFKDFTIIGEKGDKYIMESCENIDIK